MPTFTQDRRWPRSRASWMMPADPFNEAMTCCSSPYQCRLSVKQPLTWHASLSVGSGRMT